MREGPETIGRRQFLKIGAAAALASTIPGDNRDRIQEDDVGPLNYYLNSSVGNVGTAICSFQVDPAPADIRTDWEYEVARDRALARTKRKTHITHPFPPEEGGFPKFREEYRTILPRVPEINNNTFRLSLDFGRLCPHPGEFDKDLMAEYVRILAHCHYLGVEPMITLHHWTLPKAFAKYNKSTGEIEEGALEHKDILDHFTFYINEVTDFLCSKDKMRAALQDQQYPQAFVEQMLDEMAICRLFIILNEPVMMVVTPYIDGGFPPHQTFQFSKKDRLLEKLQAMYQVSYDTLHENSDRLLKGSRKPLQAGVSYSFTTPRWQVPYYGNGLVEEFEDGIESDILGVQHYFRAWIGLGDMRRNPDERQNSDHPGHGEIHPAGLYEVLKFAHGKFPKKRLWVSEFGFCDKTDERRPDVILRTVYHFIRAKREGLPVDGILLWTLINNFEWNEGMEAPFGIFDQHGQRLKSDNGKNGHISSREAWVAASKHMQKPSNESAQALSAMREKTSRQFWNARI